MVKGFGCATRVSNQRACRFSNHSTILFSHMKKDQQIREWVGETKEGGHPFIRITVQIWRERESSNEIKHPPLLASNKFAQHKALPQSSSNKLLQQCNQGCAMLKFSPFNTRQNTHTHRILVCGETRTSDSHRHYRTGKETHSQLDYDSQLSGTILNFQVLSILLTTYEKIPYRPVLSY